MNPPCVLFEDDDLLVVSKPAGMNTHAPSPHAGEGIYEWLRDREPRWSSLAIMHRLDKETSGVLLFAKTPAANRSLTTQFANHTIRKAYRFVTDRPVSFEKKTVRSALVRAGERYIDRPVHAGAEVAETRFQLISKTPGRVEVEAEPVTGKTHQIRVHAASLGCPVLGDTLYGGSPHPRVCLHAARIEGIHPRGNQPLAFAVEANFMTDSRAGLRDTLIDFADTNAFRLVHGAADGWPEWYVERLADFLLSQSADDLTDSRRKFLEELMKRHGARGVFHKRLNRQVRQTSSEIAAPRLVLGEGMDGPFELRENGLRFEADLGAGYSYGLFLDQRDNRRRLLTRHVSADFGACIAPGMEVLNAFAYTCGFSVCAARAGARVTSLDLSARYLDWGRRNFALNSLTVADHEFIRGDAFDWLRRWGRKRREFGLIILDPPTFSQSRESGVFRAEKDYGRLISAATGVAAPGGVMLVSTNAAAVQPAAFLETITTAVGQAGRRLQAFHYAPQPPDFPVNRLEPAHLKTVWLRLD